MPLVACNIREAWARIRGPLTDMVRKTHARWMPEDVFCLCSEGKASLYLDPDTGAFFVLQILQEMGQSVLFIYAGWTPPDVPVENYWPQVSELARQVGAEEIKMYGRKGFFRNRNWMFEYACYRRRV